MSLSLARRGARPARADGGELPVVLVVPARPDPKGARAGARAAAELAGLAAVRVSDSRDPGFRSLVSAADRIVVLDPGRWRAATTRAPGLCAHARTRDRLALLRLLRPSADRVRWVGNPRQWHRLLDTLTARATDGQHP